MLSGGGASRVSLFPQLWEEIHFKGLGEPGGRAEGEVHVLVQHLGDVGLGDLHALGELGLIDAELLHPAKNAPEKCRANMVDGSHFTIRSRPIAYAAEYAIVFRPMTHDAHLTLHIVNFSVNAVNAPIWRRVSYPPRQRRACAASGYSVTPCARSAISTFPQLREEVHLQRLGQFRRRAERKVHVLAKDLGDVGLGDLHALGKLGLVHAQLLHPAEDAAEERRSDMVKSLH